jgi:peptidoglycan/xylan/chitin deacetylase (PgdA/CDA1 family)
MNRVFGFLCVLLSVSPLFGQGTDLVAIHQLNPDEISIQLFENEGSEIRIVTDPFLVRSIEFFENHPDLNLAGDFDGDGRDEIAVFTDLTYTPNMNPEFTCSVIKVYKSEGDRVAPHNTWFSAADSALDFKHVSYAVAADYNGDGLCDIALLYNDPTREQVQIYVLHSTGERFSEPLPYYLVDRDEFNFTALSFASAGDFNGNGKKDLALFYNYFGTASETKQAIFLLECTNSSFTLQPAAYTGTKQDYNFSELKNVLAGDYNQDGYSDLAVIREEGAGQGVEVHVFEGSGTGTLTPRIYVEVPGETVEYAGIGHALTGEFAGDEGSDLALLYDDPLSGGQEIHVLESESGGFKTPVKHFVSSPELLQFSAFTAVLGGHFHYEPLIRACTWKNDKKGALSFTFDDGAIGAFAHGAAELEAAGLKGSFYIFTDTSAVYDSDLAETSVIREYGKLGHEIASHTHNHSNLGWLTETGNLDSLRQVLSLSRDILNERFDQQTLTLSLPYGSFRQETRDLISPYFHSARSSQYGFNLSTPYDFFALRSWPVLSSTSPAYVAMLTERASNYGYYLPLMYHDLTNQPFDEESEIYMYSRDLFRETIQQVLEKDIWVDTHANIYKYIRERNALKVEQMQLGLVDSEPGQFSFELSDNLPDSIFDVELTLKIFLPENWNEDFISMEVGDSLLLSEVHWDPRGFYVLCNTQVVDGRTIKVHEGILETHTNKHQTYLAGELKLRAYPNPISSQTQIHVEGQLHPHMQLLLMDAQGRKLKEIDLQGRNTVWLGCDALTPGMYLLILAEKGMPRSSLKLVVH